MNELKTRQNLTIEEIDAEEYGKRNWGLNGDAVFDGHFYRDRSGTILEGHPKREEILKEYIDRVNLDLHEKNELMKKQEKFRRHFYQTY